MERPRRIHERGSRTSVLIHLVAQCAALLAASSRSRADDISPSGHLTFSDVAATDVSGLAFTPDRRNALLVSDETNGILLLERICTSTTYRYTRTVELVDDDSDGETDLEAIAIAGRWVYALGSHSAKRLEVRASDFTREENLERLQSVSKQKHRRALFRCDLDELLDGSIYVKHSDLWERLKNDGVLAPFARIPGKENGVDIEALAIDDGRVLAGFRSPVLRGGFAVVMDTEFARSSSASLRFLHLGGLGIRDAFTVGSDQYLLLAGPPGPEDGPFSIYLWNGIDVIDGTDGPGAGRLTHLGQLQVPACANAGRPEGLAIFHRDNSRLTLAIVFDGVATGSPTLYVVALPAE